MKYGLLGTNIKHSLSHLLHPLIAKVNGYDVDYELIDIDETELEKYLNLLRAGVYQGYNITTPFKQKVIPYLDYVDSNVERLGACNTVMVENNKLYGYNTDHYGFLKTVEDNHLTPTDAYILGSGGAARIVFDVLKEKGFKVTTVSREAKIDDYFGKMIDYHTFYQIKEIPLLINATPVGAYPKFGNPLKKSDQRFDYVIDLIYNPPVTEIMQLGKRHINGMEMLVYQGILTQSIWQKKTLKTDQKSVDTLKGAIYEHIRKSI